MSQKSRSRAGSPVAVGLLLLAAGLPAAGDAAGTAACPDAQPRPTLSISDPGGGGPLVATHLLEARVAGPSSGFSEVRSFSAPGARIFPDEGEQRATLVSDTPGPLAVTADVEIAGSGDSCTTTVTTTVQLQRPTPSVVGRLERPRRLTVPGRRLYEREPNFSFTVKVAKVGADLSPFTVRARRSSRLRLPRRGAKPASFDVPLRDFELEAWEESLGLQTGRSCELLCSPVNRFGFRKRVAVWADRIEGDGIEVTVVPPTGLNDLVRGNFSFTPTPFGVDLEVLQSARRVARLRIAARCDLGGKGRATSCRFRTIDMRR
jgi:hypothetical protein